MIYNFGHFQIEEMNGNYYVLGNIKEATKAFKSINRRPPNKYGNFYGREKAGFEACRELIKMSEDITWISE